LSDCGTPGRDVRGHDVDHSGPTDRLDTDDVHRSFDDVKN